MVVECSQMWVLSEPRLKVGIESTYASLDHRVVAEPRSLVSKSGCRVAVKFPNRLNTHFFSGCKVVRKWSGGDCRMYLNL